MKITLEKGIKNRTMEVVMILTVTPKGKVFLELVQHNTFYYWVFTKYKGQ